MPQNDTPYTDEVTNIVFTEDSVRFDFGRLLCANKTVTLAKGETRQVAEATFRAADDILELKVGGTSWLFFSSAGEDLNPMQHDDLPDAFADKARNIYWWCYWEARLRWRTFTENVWTTLAWRALPLALRRWVVVRAFCDASSGEHSHVDPFKVNYHEVMDRMT